MYVPDMKLSFILFRKLVEKGNSMIMEDDSLKLYYSKKILVLKSVLPKNKTFKTFINVVVVVCLTTMIQ